MSSPIEITGNDIAKLDDSALRELIGLLCEADFKHSDLSTECVTWGGDQNAPDGGFDVVVDAEVAPPTRSYIKRKHTGIQVKKPDMQPADIVKEMCPANELRDSIKGLIDVNGAYIIVSSNGSASHSALQRRKKAMEECVSDHDSNKSLHLDFFDRGRVAAWVRLHPSLVFWVKGRIGSPFKGWRSYDNWANADATADEHYLADEHVRLFDGSKSDHSGYSSADGLSRLRSILEAPRQSVRLVGLSGVGKTRLVQALFDDRIGTDALPSSQVIYTDVADSPEPDPKSLIQQLIAERNRAILVVDNCPPDLHSRLTEACTRSSSTVSLISVEYDVRGDLPDETSVFRLEAASSSLIEKLVRTRFSHISEVDAGLISTASGGNARIAIALARTIKVGESISELHDSELFDRLFTQRKNPNDVLLQSAEALSLVYSFDGEDTDSEKSELAVLAKFTALDADGLFRDVYELRSRELIQARSEWRALLPQAIANRLAAEAFRKIPKKKIESVFHGSGSQRLIRSFTRRLSFLHETSEVVDLVEGWLIESGWLGNITSLNHFGMEVFKNIAPVSPDATLRAIENASKTKEGNSFASRENPNHTHFVKILKSIGYEAELFSRSVKVMTMFALSEDVAENVNSTRDVLRSLFHLHLSGTWAELDQRLAVISDLVAAEGQSEKELGLMLFESTLEAWHFGSHDTFEFGSRSRDFGYQPRSIDETSSWYGSVIQFGLNMIQGSPELSQEIRSMFASKFRGLWNHGFVTDALETMASSLNEQRAWVEGWVAVRETLYFESRSGVTDNLEKLRRIEKSLRPVSLVENARTYCFADRSYTLDMIADDEDEVVVGSNSLDDFTKQLGLQVAGDEGALSDLINELVSKEGRRLVVFGEGLAKGASNRRQLWDRIREAALATSASDRNINVLVGYVRGLSDLNSEDRDIVLDGILADEFLGQWFPLFQVAAGFDPKGIKRFLNSIDVGMAPSWTYERLGWGRAHESLSDLELTLVLEKIVFIPDGKSVCLDILSMRFHGKKSGESFQQELLRFGRDLLSEYEYGESRGRVDTKDYELSSVSRVCLEGVEGEAATKGFCRVSTDAIYNGSVYSFDLPSTLECLAKLHPLIFLDEFLGREQSDDYRYRRRMFSEYSRDENPLKHISDEHLIEWCSKDPINRYNVLAGVIQTFDKPDKESDYEWMTIFYEMIRRAPDLEKVLEEVANRISPTSWSGSMSHHLAERLVLFDALMSNEDSQVRAWAVQTRKEVERWIRGEIEREQSWNRKRDESFE
ncbi:MAG: hypothetical protein GKS03_07780 [Alphaproteobacteria bacterium]|nr:hypothetical protein [Alphaproteobacteria bacterium]